MIRPFLIGLGTTFRHMFKKKVAVNYPEQKVPMFPKYRGKQVLTRDENGLEKCVACGLCSAACPADAIYLEAEENDGTVLAGPRYAKVYQIHKTRCIFCGYCEDACPVSAIFMGKDYELAVYSKDDFIWDKEAHARAGVRLMRSPPRRRSFASSSSYMKPFLDALDERVLVCDGAMGTMLYSKGVFINRCFDALNLAERRPPWPRFMTSTFCAGADVHRDQYLWRQPDQAARVRLGRPPARHQCGGSSPRDGVPRGARRTSRARWVRSVSASSRVAGWGSAEAEAYFPRAGGGVAGRWSRPLFVHGNVPRRDRAAGCHCGRPFGASATLPVVAQMTIEEDGSSFDGAPPERFVPALEPHADVVRRELQHWPGADARDDRADVGD